MMVTIGSRYLVFATMFGPSIFWVMGACLIVAGIIALYAAIPPLFAASLGGMIEALFSFSVFLKPAAVVETPCNDRVA